MATSLQILNPKSFALPTKERAVSQAAKKLETLATQLVYNINTRNWSEEDFSTILAPNVEAELPQIGNANLGGLQNYIESYAALCDTNPDYFVDILSLTTSIDLRNGTGIVWVYMSITGHPRNLRRENVTALTFHRRDSEWRIVKQKGFRGCSSLAGSEIDGGLMDLLSSDCGA